MGGGGGRAPAVDHVNHEAPDAGANDGAPGWFHRTTGVPFVQLATLGMHRPEPRRPGSESQRFLDKFELEHGPVHPTPQVSSRSPCIRLRFARGFPLVSALPQPPAFTDGHSSL